MSWVNLNDVYVNKTGDTIDGDLSVGGALTINDGKGTDTTYNVANEITTLRDSVSHLQKCDMITLYGGAGKASYVFIQRVGRTCILTWAVSQQTSEYWGIERAIPENLRPDHTIYCSSCVTNANGYILNVCAYGYVHQSGTIGFQVAAATSGAINRGTCSWYIN